MLFRLHKVLGTVKLKILIKSQSKRRIGLNILGTFRSKLMVSWMTQTPEKFYNNLLKNKVRFKKKKKKWKQDLIPHYIQKDPMNTSILSYFFHCRFILTFCSRCLKWSLKKRLQVFEAMYLNQKNYGIL